MKEPTKPKITKLTPKQALFCKEYLIDLCATQAAIRSGYSKKTAFSIGAENLTKPLIRAELKRNMAKHAEKIELTADRVLAEISKMAYANMADYMTFTADGSAFVDLSKLTRDQAAALSEVDVDSYYDKDNKRNVDKIKIKLSDKRGNLELLGRYLKLFTDKMQVEGPSGKPVLVDVTSMKSEELARLIAEELKK